MLTGFIYCVFEATLSGMFSLSHLYLVSGVLHFQVEEAILGEWLIASMPANK